MGVCAGVLERGRDTGTVGVERSVSISYNAGSAEIAGIPRAWKAVRMIAYRGRITTGGRIVHGMGVAAVAGITDSVRTASPMMNRFMRFGVPFSPLHTSDRCRSRR